MPVGQNPDFVGEKRHRQGIAVAQQEDRTEEIEQAMDQAVHYMWEGEPISREDLQSRLDEMRAVMEEADENRRRGGYGG